MTGIDCSALCDRHTDAMKRTKITFFLIMSKLNQSILDIFQCVGMPIAEPGTANPTGVLDGTAGVA